MTRVNCKQFHFGWVSERERCFKLGLSSSEAETKSSQQFGQLLFQMFYSIRLHIDRNHDLALQSSKPARQKNVKGLLHDATLRAILHAMGKLHRMAAIEIVACNIARNISEVESNSTSAALRATISLNFIVSTLCNIDDDQLLICLLFQRHNSGLYSFNHISIANLGMYAHARVNKQNGGPGSHGSEPGQLCDCLVTRRGNYPHKL